MSPRATILPLVLAIAGSVGAAAAAPADAPPMNTNYSAYYVCSGGKTAFVIAYATPKLESATITTNTDASYTVRKSPVSSGFMYSNRAGVSFWTDGTRVSLTGTKQPYTDCQLHGS